jgi:hypothetical protein
MMTKSSRPKRFITVPELRERWGGVSQMFVERKIKEDPTFPTIYRMSRHRLFDLDEVEAYERRSVARKG